MKQLASVHPRSEKHAVAIARAISELGYATGVQPNGAHILIYPEDAAAINESMPGVLADLGLEYAFAEEVEKAS